MGFKPLAINVYSESEQLEDQLLGCFMFLLPLGKSPVSRSPCTPPRSSQDDLQTYTHTHTSEATAKLEHNNSSPSAVSVCDLRDQSSHSRRSSATIALSRMP